MKLILKVLGMILEEVEVCVVMLLEMELFGIFDVVMLCFIVKYVIVDVIFDFCDGIDIYWVC